MPVQVTTILHISNLHCPSCSRRISEILWLLSPGPLSVSVSVSSQIVTITHSSDLLPMGIVQALLEADFEVDNLALVDGTQRVDPDSIFDAGEVMTAFVETRRLLEDARGLVRNFVRNSIRGSARRHLDNCEKCQKENSGETVNPNFDKRFSRKGPLSPTFSEETKNYGLSPWGNAHQALLSIGGMTCSVCTGKVTEVIEGLGPWIRDVSINLMSNSGLVTFQTSGDGKVEAQTIVDEIESIGYEVTLNRLTNLTPEITDEEPNGKRSIALNVKGITCEDCTKKIVQALETTFPGVLVIETEPTVHSPALRLTYTPKLPDITIRKIIDVITSIEPGFEVSVFHQLSIEQRSQQIRQKERSDYLFRLALCLVCAIPTFLIGVVWMALVPESDHVRMYLATPLWIGNVSRTEWALLILSTPIMFYAANPFHTRAIREIMSLWRRGSSVPVLRRFYRFGSMNLLISLGVSMSYFSSIAMLVLAAGKPPSHTNMMKGHMTTYFDSTVFLTMFLLMGRFLEAYTKAKTANGVSLLAGLRPKEAVLLEPVQNGLTQAEIEASVKPSPVPETFEINPEYSDNRPVTTRRIPVDLLEVGDIVTIAQGSSPPSDATVTSGVSSFDESSLTGESKPTPKSVGDEVYAGTINVGQVINARIEKITGESMIDEIVDVIREGQNRRAPIERIADRVTAYFVPTICFLAISTWIIWLTLGVSGSLPANYLDTNEGSWYLWSLSFAIAVFVVACPCGIGLAAPCALYVGTGLATSYAILARGGGEAFQEASRLDRIIFDKTGTLTKGVEPVITNEKIVLQGEFALRVTYLVSKLIEEGSSHPLARAIVNYCNKRSTANGRCVSMEEVAGMGSKGSIEIEGIVYEAIIGSERFLDEHDVVMTGMHVDLLHSWKQQGKSVILLAIKSNTCSTFGSAFSLAAMFATTDPIREEAPSVISELRNNGMDVWMITGDNPTTASAIAGLVGIPENRVVAGLLPAEKADKVRELQFLATPRTKLSFLPWRRTPKVKQRAIVAMVGDGINDAPAISMADVGISIGSGTDIAMQTSKFILVSSDLRSLLTLTELSRAVVGRVKTNFLWACIFNIVTIPLAAGAFIPLTPQRIRLEPVWAALAMALSSVSVIGSSLLLKSNIWGLGFRPRGRR
ncbi:E1-E2 ATPase-domain-containing protein [Trichophaea hybrida]|nr:E1-E2 ATPase-domain-containing protein [Trichophaea hybrida]